MKCADGLTLQNSFYPHGRVLTRHRGEPQWCKTLFYITLHEVESAWWIIPAVSSYRVEGWRRRQRRRGAQHAWNCSRRGCRTSALSVWIIACLMTGVSNKPRFQTSSRGANSLSRFQLDNLSRIEFLLDAIRQFSKRWISSRDLWRNKCFICDFTLKCIRQGNSY